LRTHRRFIQDAAWIAALMLAGFVSILIDATVGYARFVALVAGKAL
jgi:hypothetical protein